MWSIKQIRVLNCLWAFFSVFTTVILKDKLEEPSLQESGNVLASVVKSAVSMFTAKVRAEF